MRNPDRPNDEFAFQLSAYGIPYEREFRAVHGTRYRWDFRISGTNILIEINGGLWIKSGHTTPKGISRDYRKANLAVLNGWRQLTFNADDVRSGEAIGFILKLLKSLKED